MTDVEYNAGLELIERADPGNALLPDLKKGPSKINFIYMKKVIKNVEEIRSEEAQGKPDDPEDLILKNMQQKRRALYAKRAKLSNAFHKCRTKKDRAFNSEKIQLVQQEIMETEREMRHYKVSGEQPSGPFDHLPDNDYKLFQLKENARKNIPRIEERLEEWFAKPEGTPGRAKQIATDEKKLAESKRLIAYVEKRLKEKGL